MSRGFLTRVQAANGKGTKHVEALRLRVKEYKEHLAAARRDAKQAARTIRTFEARPYHASNGPALPVGLASLREGSSPPTFRSTPFRETLKI